MGRYQFVCILYVTEHGGSLHDITPVSVGLHVLQRGEHGVHPQGTGADLSGVGEVVVTERLLKLTQHLLEVGKVVVFLVERVGSYIHSKQFRELRMQ